MITWEPVVLRQNLKNRTEVLKAVSKRSSRKERFEKNKQKYNKTMFSSYGNIVNSFR